MVDKDTCVVCGEDVSDLSTHVCDNCKRKYNVEDKHSYSPADILLNVLRPDQC